VLLSGDHAAIERWRLEQAILKTQRNRPDLHERFSRMRQKEQQA
jgi:tRNA (guanine37-N1)-methyltransferase